jgi:WD40 repeat protein
VIAAGDYGRSVRLSRVADGALLHETAGHGEGVTAVAFSPDGGTLASGSFDASLRLWDVRG